MSSRAVTLFRVTLTTDVTACPLREGTAAPADMQPARVHSALRSSLPSQGSSMSCHCPLPALGTVPSPTWQPGPVAGTMPFTAA